MTPLPALDTATSCQFNLYTGASGSEVLIMQFPWSMYMDTSTGHQPEMRMMFPEPKQVSANTRISVKVADINSSALTYTGFKTLYYA
jgi:hypothetical protein